MNVFAKLWKPQDLLCKQGLYRFIQLHFFPPSWLRQEAWEAVWLAFIYCLTRARKEWCSRQWLHKFVNVHRVRTESWILEKVLKFAQQFFRPGKSLENRAKVLKKWLKVLSFFKVTCTLSALQVRCFFCVCAGQILFILACMFAVHHGKSFVLSFLVWPWVWKRKLLYLKSLEKVLQFGFKNLYEPCVNTTCSLF